LVLCHNRDERGRLIATNYIARGRQGGKARDFIETG
jgi:hypothetical protein